LSVLVLAGRKIVALGDQGARVADHVLDARGLLCPLPVLRANKVMKTLQVGAELEVLASDAAAPQDFVSFCRTTGHVLVDSREADGVFTIILRKTG
jgi:tRNA 2-thiouridine synthesizing protein A